MSLLRCVPGGCPPLPGLHPVPQQQQNSLTEGRPENARLRPATWGRQTAALPAPPSLPEWGQDGQARGSAACSSWRGGCGAASLEAPGKGLPPPNPWDQGIHRAPQRRPSKARSLKMLFLKTVPTVHVRCSRQAAMRPRGAELLQQGSPLSATRPSLLRDQRLDLPLRRERRPGSS